MKLAAVATWIRQANLLKVGATSSALFLPLIVAAAYVNASSPPPPTPVNFVVTDSTGGAVADDGSWEGVVSSDGVSVVFSSYANNLGAPDNGSIANVFVHDVLSNETTWISRANFLFAIDPAVTADGDYAVFAVYGNILPGWSGWAVFGADTSGTGNAPELLSYPDGSVDPQPTISGDGRYVAYRTGNVTSGDTNGLNDIHVRDRQTNQVYPAGRPSGSQYNVHAHSPKLAKDANRLVYQLGTQWIHFTDWPSCGVFGCFGETLAGTRPSISDDGTKIAYQGSDGGYDGIFVFDETTGTPQRVSIDAYGRPASAECDYPVISGDGRFVAFRCAEAMTSHGGTNQTYVRDLVAEKTKLASITSTGIPANQGAIPTSMGLGGLVLILESTSTNLGTIAAGTKQVFRTTSGYWREGDTCLPSSSVDTTCDQVDDDCDGLVDDDYDEVAEQTTCGINECASGAFTCIRGFEYDTCNSDCSGGGSPEVINFTVSKTAEEVAANDQSWEPVASADGDVVAFSSLATNLDPGADELANPTGLGPKHDVFVRDTTSGQTTWVSDIGTEEQVRPAISADGRYVAFYGTSGNVLPNVYTSVSIVDLHVPNSPPEIHDFVGPVAGVALSGDGRYLAVANPFSRYWTQAGWEYTGEGLVVLDRITGERTELPYASGGGASSVESPEITPDGFWTTFVHRNSLGARVIVVASHQTGELFSSFGGTAPSISDDGRLIAYQELTYNGSFTESYASGIWVYDRATDTHIRVSVPAYGNTDGDDCWSPVISGNGEFVAFGCSEPMTSHGVEGQAYIRDLVNQTTKLASVHPNGEPADAPASPAAMAEDGSAVVISSRASNLGLVSGEHSQVFRIPSPYWQRGCGDGSVSEMICNGVDDDCDGQADEDFVPITTICGLGGCNTGVMSCVAGLAIDSCDPDCGTGGPIGPGGPCPSDSSLAAHWLADGNTFELVSRSVASTGGDLAFVDGVQGQAFSFDPSDGVDWVSANVPLVQDATAITLAVWFRTPDNSGSADLLAFPWGPKLGIGVGKPTVRLYAAGSFFASVLASPLPDVWHHMAATGDANYWSLYLDGQLVGGGQTTVPSPIFGGDSTTKLVIACNSDLTQFATACFTGDLDGAAIYNRVLSADEIAELYDAQAGFYCGN